MFEAPGHDVFCFYGRSISFERKRMEYRRTGEKFTTN